MSKRLEEIEKILWLLGSGEYYRASNKRNKLLFSLNEIIKTLNKKESNQYNKKIINLFPDLITLREDNKISHKTLWELLKYTNLSINDHSTYNIFKEWVIEKLKKNKSKYYFYFFDLYNLAYDIDEDVDELEDYFIEKFLKLRWANGWLATQYIWQLNYFCNTFNKVKIMRHLLELQPFRNDYIVKWYIKSNKELNKYANII